jgi:hypothetical protein
MSTTDEIRRDGNQLLDEHFRRLQEGSMPGDGTWDDWIERASSLSERCESAGFQEAAADLRQFAETAKTGRLDKESEREIEQDLKRMKRLTMLVLIGLAVATIAITFIGLAALFVAFCAEFQPVRQCYSLGSLPLRWRLVL